MKHSRQDVQAPTANPKDVLVQKLVFVFSEERCKRTRRTGQRIGQFLKKDLWSALRKPLKVATQWPSKPFVSIAEEDRDGFLCFLSRMVGVGSSSTV